MSSCFYSVIKIGSLQVLATSETKPCGHFQKTETNSPPHTHTYTQTAMAKVFAKHKMLVAMSKHIEVEEV